MFSHTSKHLVVSPEQTLSQKDESVVLGAEVFLRFLSQAKGIHACGLKSYGVFIADITGSPFRPVDVRFFDPRRNRRNDPENRAAFEAQGSYFRAHLDAGFVVDGKEVANLERALSRAGQTIVSPFHSHRRQPANFSSIDYNLHNPFFSWHLVICLVNPDMPQIQPYRVDKSFDDFGIDASDAHENSERDYPGDNVRPVDLIVEGTEVQLDSVAWALGLETVCAVDQHVRR